MTDASPFEAALRKLTHGVYIVTTRRGDTVNGLAAAWVCRVSFNPPLLAVSVGKSRYSHDLIAGAGAFAVNVMNESAVKLTRFFGECSGRETDKFSGVNHFAAKTGSPILPDAIAWLDCKLVHSYPAGDHTLFVGEVVDAAVIKDTPPLVYRRADFQ